MKLNKTALGLTLGVICGAAVLLATAFSAWRGGGEHLILLSGFYLGYSVTYTGALIGLIYGFIDGFIGGWLIAWLLNVSFLVAQCALTESTTLIQLSGLLG